MPRQLRGSLTLEILKLFDPTLFPLSVYAEQYVTQILGKTDTLERSSLERTMAEWVITPWLQDVQFGEAEDDD